MQIPQMRTRIPVPTLLERRNSIHSISDSRRKCLKSHPVREYMRKTGIPKDNEGPFFLDHLGLPGANVLIDPATWTICVNYRLGRSMRLSRCLCNSLVDTSITREQNLLVHVIAYQIEKLPCIASCAMQFRWPPRTRIDDLLSLPISC